MKRIGRKFVNSPRWLSAAGVLAAGVIAVQLNVLVARHYTRWDFTSHGTYTLSNPTRELLASLDEPVEITVLLARSDRLLVDTRHLLDAYRGVTSRLRVRYVDPDAEPAQFLALQERYGIAAGATQDGRVVADASLIISQQDRHWFVSADELVHFDDEGNAQARIEAALTEGIARVISRSREWICFTTGHGESALDDGGPQGLAEVRHRLERSNFEVESVSLGSIPTDADPSEPGGDSSLDGCLVVVVAGPERAIGQTAAAALRDYVASGGNLLLLLNPIVDDDGRLLRSGLESPASLAGIELEPAFVIEQDEASRLPRGVGEAFFARPLVHPVTRGLALTEERIETLPLLIAAQPLRTSADSPASAVLQSSGRAFTVDDLRPLEAAGGTLPNPRTSSEPLTLAYAAELPPAPTQSAPGREAKPRRGARIVVVGAANPMWSRNWRDPALFGTRLFTENILAWLADRPALVSVPERPRFAATLTLTDESLGEIQRYVLIYMPLTAALGGLLLLLGRRRTEQLSRKREEP